MSWDNFTIMTEQEVMSTGDELPTQYQPGMEVALNFYLTDDITMPTRECFKIRAWVVEVHLGASSINYSVGIPIGNGLYIKYRPKRGCLSLPDEVLDERDVPVPLEDVTTKLRIMEQASQAPLPDIPVLSLVVNNSVREHTDNG